MTFYYDHRTHWVTNDLLSDIVVATGSFQCEMGCATDKDPTCMRAWLQDPDGDGVYSLGVTDIPAGTYTVQAVKNGGGRDPAASPSTRARSRRSPSTRPVAR